MALTIDEVRRIAILARLRLTSEEESIFAAQLGRIVEYIDQLSAFEAVEPGNGQAATPAAADVAGECLPWPAIQRNAPATLETFFVVPQVKGDDV